MSKIVNLRPVFNNIIVEQVKAQEKTESGFYMPESSQKKPNVYLVKEVGPECKSGVKAGDFIVLPKNIQVCTDIEVNGNVVSVVEEKHIIAIVNVEN